MLTLGGRCLPPAAVPRGRSATTTGQLRQTVTVCAQPRAAAAPQNPPSVEYAVRRAMSPAAARFRVPSPRTAPTPHAPDVVAAGFGTAADVDRMLAQHFKQLLEVSANALHA